MKAASRTRLLGTTAVLALTLTGCAYSTSAYQPDTPSTSSTPEEARLANQQFSNATDLAAALTYAGVTCEDEQVVDPPGKYASSQVACNTQAFGTLGLYVFDSTTAMEQWIAGLAILCGNPAGDNVLAGPNWFILPTAGRGDAVPAYLVAAKSVPVRSVCPVTSAGTPTSAGLNAEEWAKQKGAVLVEGWLIDYGNVTGQNPQNDSIRSDGGSRESLDQADILLAPDDLEPPFQRVFNATVAMRQAIDKTTDIGAFLPPDSWNAEQKSAVKEFIAAMRALRAAGIWQLTKRYCASLQAVGCKVWSYK